MPSSQLSCGWDIEGALTQEELDPTFQYISDDIPSADKYYRIRKLQEQQEKKGQGPNPAPPSPTVSFASKYGQSPLHEMPNMWEKSHPYIQDYRTARRNLGPPVWAQHKRSVARPAPQKKPSSDDGGCCLVM
ncbi:uncharacterized protein EAF01_010442 [Botrytis porri]|uniref:uncharacterized protein n=1 Tax=Botrytis porri TaxID=87229 RepID=UPI0018FF14B7|nr:uncharacterized protein EAF01_010442 [Botrytis porri]KAF7892362.1 hypothetical protein EAF01_010442 [Botrytis porri]